MSYESWNVGTAGQVIKYVEDASDFPSNGISISDSPYILIENNSGSSVELKLTMDSQDKIEKEGTEDPYFVSYSTINDGSVSDFSFDPGPTGIFVDASSSGCSVWIRT